MNTTPTYGSLFSGVGGFDMGFDQAGFDCVFQVEWDPHCQTVLQRHWKNVPKWTDVQTVNGAELPPCDILTFGSPCQDLSVAGKQKGLAGDKSSMFFEATRIIKEMQNATGGTYPRVVVWENVPGALSSNRGADFQAVLNEMADCRSHLIEWAVLDAQHFGVSQRRRRIFLVAVLDPAIASRCPDPLLPVAKGSPRDYQKGIPTRQTATGTLEEGSTSNSEPDTAMTFTAQRVGEAPRIYEDSTPALLSRMGTGGNNTPMVAQTVSFGWQEQRYAGDTHEEIVTALTTTKTQAIQTEHLVRRLTPLECERLMGWSDDHTRWRADGTEQSDSQRYKQCGNGVATPVARWVAQQIKETL